RSWLMRFHCQTAGVTLTAQQPLNNVVRVAYQALAAVLGGTQSLHTNSLDETLALPTEEAVRLALRTQQIIAHETGVPEVIDPLGGSSYVESLTDQLEREAEALFAEIQSIGGVVKGIEDGWFQRQIARSAEQFQREAEQGKRIVVGVNEFTSEDDHPVEILKIANDAEQDQRRLPAIVPGSHRVVSCYLKLEPRDKTRGKYLIKMKNRIREALALLEGQTLDRAVRDAVAADLERVRRYFEEPGRLPPSRGIAIFACRSLGLFEALALPHVHRSRLRVDATPLIRELVALEQEFGTILVAACDRTGARFFEVTAFDVAELPGLMAEATRPGKFHGERQAKKGTVLAGGYGEHNYN